MVRKEYGKDKIRYLRCTCCGQEFSERKGTALWNTKVSEAKAVSVAEHLSEGCSQESTARLVKVDISVVQRLKGVLGKQGHLFHEERVKGVEVEQIRKSLAFSRRPGAKEALGGGALPSTTGVATIAHYACLCYSPWVKRTRAIAVVNP